MSTQRLRHVGALDGLRGLAVLAVLVYHLDEGWLPGGFLGVSLFFTLSGFLITNLLLNEWEANRRVGLGNFWSRRFRRLLPAALAGLALAVVTAWWWADAHQLENLRGDVLAALGYVANWRFVINGDAYGAGFQEPSPVLHYWSLAIEEQFYIFVAIVALVVARYARHRRAWFVTFGGLAALSMLATVRLWGTADTNRIYFGSDTRAFELLAGVLLAIVIRFQVPTRVARWSARHVVWLVAALGMVAAVALADVQQAWLYHGGFWMVALGSVLLIVASLDTGPLATGLGWKPFAALGLISYGVYLYHWPIVIFVTSDRTGLDGVPLAALQVAITLGLAIASYHFLEQPVRQRRWSIRPVGVLGAVGAAVVVLLISTTVLDRASTTRDVVATPDLALSTTGPAAASAEGSGPVTDQAGVPLERVLLLGDSLVHQSARTLASRMHDAGIETRIIGGDGEHLLWNGRARGLLWLGIAVAHRNRRRRRRHAPATRHRCLLAGVGPHGGPAHRRCPLPEPGRVVGRRAARPDQRLLRTGRGSDRRGQRHLPRARIVSSRRRPARLDDRGRPERRVRLVPRRRLGAARASTPLRRLALHAGGPGGARRRHRRRGRGALAGVRPQPIDCGRCRCTILWPVTSRHDRCTARRPRSRLRHLG
jgi:peptidoglycan/LPS O-acetylase OafA/YrhL